jgi:hypothetical protein
VSLNYIFLRHCTNNDLPIKLINIFKINLIKMQSNYDLTEEDVEDFLKYTVIFNLILG